MDVPICCFCGTYISQRLREFKIQTSDLIFCQNKSHENKFSHESVESATKSEFVSEIGKEDTFEDWSLKIE